MDSARLVPDGPGRDRTCDLRIKSPLLYQLSYRPVYGAIEADARDQEPVVPAGIASTGASAFAPAPSTSRWGSRRSSQAGSHQLPLPARTSTAGENTSTHTAARATPT